MIEPDPLTVDLRKALLYNEYLKALPSMAGAESELQDSSPDELRAMVLVWLSQFKRQQMKATPYTEDGPEGWNRYVRWTNPRGVE